MRYCNCNRQENRVRRNSDGEGTGSWSRSRFGATTAGCGGSDDESAAQTLDERVATVADAPTPADGMLPTDGPYVVVERGPDYRGPRSGCRRHRYAGEFRLDLREDGTYTLFNDFNGETTGLYGAASDDFLVFTDDTGCAENFAGSGVYQWAVDGDQLTLTLVQARDGGCTGRSDTLTISRWKRVED